MTNDPVRALVEQVVNAIGCIIVAILSSLFGNGDC